MSDEQTLLSRFNLEADSLDDAINYVRGHIVLNDKDAALLSLGDAQNALNRIEELLEEQS